jgi:hypothetical protein
MIQLEILSGKSAGTRWSARRFPVRVGRSSDSDLQIEGPGVWDEHFKLTFVAADGFIVEAHSDAMVILNDQTVKRAALRNGDKIDAGSARLRFWIAEARQSDLTFREALTWAVLLAVTLGQLGIIYWLLP